MTDEEARKQMVERLNEAMGGDDHTCAPKWRIAVRRLKDAGYPNVAAVVEGWRNRNGKRGGWDGWFRGRDGYPELTGIVWP